MQETNFTKTTGLAKQAVPCFSKREREEKRMLIPVIEGQKENVLLLSTKNNSRMNIDMLKKTDKLYFFFWKNVLF